ncbi:glycoside hydrolase family 9 protein, partial [Porcipelethomonas sp.]|uniref:glycoside hydrolase family 9 protein n=1 Tax=Porcipelethomonas sp. TaxID=2981675 RepID=UPI003EF52384
MHNKFTKAITASVMAAAMLTTTVATVAPMTVSAGEILGESTFDYKALPWHTCETNPAKQSFDLDNGMFHVTIINPKGGDGDRWDLQTRHRNLNFKSGHKYTITWSAKANRQGVLVYTKIGNIKGDEEYWVSGGQGPAMGGSWDNAKAVELTTSMQTFTSTFNCTKDLEGVEWAFHYAVGGSTTGSGENSKAGDEIWFDNMSIVDTTGSQDDRDQDDLTTLGVMRRDDSGLDNNFISVNQIGYYTNLSKVATLGDNKGDITHNASTIDLSDSSYEFKVINDETNEVALTGQTTPKGKDRDSGDNVHTIDFTELDQPGRYHIEVGEWQSFSFNIGNDIYTDTSHNMLTNALNYYYQNRSGIDIEEAYITSGDKSSLAHVGGHKTDTAAVQTQWVQTYSSKSEATGTYRSSDITATGGWYDAGDHGKYVVNGGISVWTLQNMYERAVAQDNAEKFADGSGTVVVPETGNNVPDILDEAAVELDWMMKMVVQSDEPTWGKYAGLVYHKLHDHKWTGLATRPYDYESEWGTVRIVKPPTFAATLNFVACAAQAARLWEPYDSAKAAKYLEAAKTSYEAYKKYFYEYTDAEASNAKSLYAPLDQAIGGGAYGDTNVKDDAYWAACELYATTGDAEYYTDLSSYSDAFKVVSYLEGGENKGSFGSFNWGNTASCGSLTLYLNEDNSKLTSLTDANKTSITESLTAAADLYIDKEDEQGYGIPYEGTKYTDPVNLPEDLVIDGFEWGSNSFAINNAMVMAYAYDITEDAKYMNGVTTAMDYLLGRNPLSVSYVTGYGSYHVSRPHHRYWSYELDKTLPMAPDGVMSGGPNAGLQDPYVRALGFVPGDADNPSERCYVDSIEAWSTNEVTINWNAPF